MLTYRPWIVIERSASKAPIYKTPVRDGESVLRRYISLPEQCLSVLGPRRIPVLPAPAHNTNSSVAISTSVGFRFLEAKDYEAAIKSLGADVSLSLADVITSETASTKRIEKSADRTHAWFRDRVESKDAAPGPVFASIPPIAPERLSFYLSDLEKEFRSSLSGLAIYSSSTAAAIAEPLRSVPIISLTNPSTPQALLAAIHSGVDLISVPFITQASEHGIALDFTFPGTPASTPKPLGTDLWSTTHATDISPLSPACSCYACSRHHRAYVHHLLQANEMIAWTLLQIHNFHILESFFTSVRQNIANGAFDQDTKTFERTYESEMPEQTGQGPRIRGYQAKSVGGGEPKRNAKAWGKVDDQLQKLAEAESGVATPEGDAGDLEEHGLGSKSTE